MTIMTRLAKLESKGGAEELSLTTRAWLGYTLSPTEQRQALIEASRELPSPDWSSISKEAREWLQA